MKFPDLVIYKENLRYILSGFYFLQESMEKVFWGGKCLGCDQTFIFFLQFSQFIKFVSFLKLT